MQDLTAATPRSAPPARNTLGDRVRHLRIAKGLTQTDLAGERFSKEYVSQIERGKTRPTGETIEWLAARLGVDQSFLETGVSSSERERVESVIARAEAALESQRYEDAVDELRAARRRARVRRRPSSCCARCSPSRGAACTSARFARPSRGSTRARAARRGADLQRPRPRRGPLPARRLQVQALVDRDLGGAARRGARARRALRASVRPAALEHPRLALALLPAPARLGGCARGRRAALELAEGLERPRARRARAISRPRSSPSGTGHWVLARSYAERAKTLTRSSPTGQRRQAAEQPRRPQLPARQARGGDRAT